MMEMMERCIIVPVEVWQQTQERISGVSRSSWCSRAPRPTDVDDIKYTMNNCNDDGFWQRAMYDYSTMRCAYVGTCLTQSRRRVGEHHQPLNKLAQANTTIAADP